jgi:hypothetical protein
VKYLVQEELELELMEAEHVMKERRRLQAGIGFAGGS